MASYGRRLAGAEGKTVGGEITPDPLDMLFQGFCCRNGTGTDGGVLLVGIVPTDCCGGAARCVLVGRCID
eukprot:1793406-Amphidinium_carterae.1